jgi:hypothetical protein
VNDRNISLPYHLVRSVGSRSNGGKDRLTGSSGRAIEEGGLCQCKAVPVLFRLSVKVLPQSFYYCKILYSENKRGRLLISGIEGKTVKREMSKMAII